MALIKNKEIGKAERALIDAKIEITKLKNERKKTVDKRIAKKLQKQIRKIEDSFIHLKRNAYLESKRKQDSIYKPSEEDILKAEEEVLGNLVNQDLAKRKSIKHNHPLESEVLKPDKPACQSCGAPLKDVYGVLRCKCN